jgi:hypothetical protein
LDSCNILGDAVSNRNKKETERIRENDIGIYRGIKCLEKKSSMLKRENCFCVTSARNITSLLFTT